MNAQASTYEGDELSFHELANRHMHTEEIPLQLESEVILSLFPLKRRKQYEQSF